MKARESMTAAAAALTRELGAFSHELSVTDRVWRLLFPDERGRWQYLHVSRYRDTFYLTSGSRDVGSLEVEAKGTVRAPSPGGFPYRGLDDPDRLEAAWGPLIAAARRWLEVVARDWIKANARIRTEYPLQLRYGIVPHALVRASLPEAPRLDLELGRTRTRSLVRLVEEGFFSRSESTEVPSMSADDYFQYCRIAYLAGRRREETVDPRLSGREMYRLFADGRHEGLLDIDPSSAREFAEWIDGTHPKRDRGGHPWEIKRGGNTTHIDLAVSRPTSYRGEGFAVVLRGESISRMVETMRMFLAIHDAGLPVSIANPDGVRKRLLAQDNIGLVPSHESLHRANQRFRPEEDVFDVMHFDELGRFKRRLTPFVTWEPLPLLRPRDA